MVIAFTKSGCEKNTGTGYHNAKNIQQDLVEHIIFYIFFEEFFFIFLHVSFYHLLHNKRLWKEYRYKVAYIEIVVYIVEISIYRISAVKTFNSCIHTKCHPNLVYWPYARLPGHLGLNKTKRPWHQSKCWTKQLRGSWIFMLSYWLHILACMTMCLRVTAIQLVK